MSSSVSGVSLTAVILTRNEEVHIERCIRSLLPVVSKVFIVDSFSTDRTVEIARSLGAEVLQRKWKNYADQFQWGMDNCGVSDWLMRMDADEYLEPDLQNEILNGLSVLPREVVGVHLNRKHFFYGRWIRFGGRYPLKLLRIWRGGEGRIEQRWMDEHILLPQGAKTVSFKGGLVDDNLKGITFFVDKHNSYATREAVDILNEKYGMFEVDAVMRTQNRSQAKYRRLIKDRIYARLPGGARSLVYFIYRIVFQLGFLDGWKGIAYHFMQGLWYRTLVDMKIYEIETESKGDVEKMKLIFAEKYGIKLS